MEQHALKKMLAGLSIAGLVAGVTLTGCQQASGGCGTPGSTKAEKVEGEGAAKGNGSCTATEAPSAKGNGSCSATKEGAKPAEGSK